jgi:tRNA threonylcarbamoyl adenosine modification protein (Sua5/YciO/YrdC/YwlC family)
MKRGALVVLPTENAYVLATDAFSARGCAALRQLKAYSSDTPLGVLVPRPSTVAGIAAGVTPSVSDAMRAVWPGLVTFLLPAQTTLNWDHPPESPIAVRMPNHPVALAVLRELGPMAVSPLPGADGAAQRSIPGLDVDGVDVVLDAGALDGHAGTWENSAKPSTVIDFTTSAPRIVRDGAWDEQRLRVLIPGLCDGE